MKKGNKVKLVATDDRQIDRFKIGLTGTILATRQLPSDINPQALVKFYGKSCPVSVNQFQLKQI